MIRTPGLGRLTRIAALALGLSACAAAAPEEARLEPEAGSNPGHNPLLGAWEMTPTATQQAWIDSVGLDRLRFTREAMVKRDEAVPVRYTVQGDFVLVRAMMGEFYVYEVLAADRVCLQGIGIAAEQGDDDPGPTEERVCYQRV